MEPGSRPRQRADVDGLRDWNGIVEVLPTADPVGPPAVLRLEQFDVLWWERGIREGAAEASGRLFQDGHSECGDLIAPSTGTVVAVRVEHRRFVAPADSVGLSFWTPTDEPAGYRAVEVSPKWFSGEQVTGSRSRRIETGVLVEVEITDGGRHRPSKGCPVVVRD